MKVPQSLSDRLDEYSNLIASNVRQREILETAAHELEEAIRAIADEPEGEPHSAAEANPLELATAIARAAGAGASSASLTAPANSETAGQRAARRDIKALVMDELTRATQPHTAKEIAKAIEAGPQSTAAALEHWKAQGAAVEVDGKWHRSAAQNVVNGPMPPNALPPPLVPRQASSPAQAPTDDVAVSTQDKLVQALKAAAAAGMTADELAEVGIPYITVMQYDRLGWLRQDAAGRYYLNSQAQ